MAYNLRGTQKLNLPRVTTTSFGFQWFRYSVPQGWNILSDDIRTSQSLFAFKRAGPQYFSADFMHVFQNRFHVAVRLFSNRLQNGS